MLSKRIAFLFLALVLVLPAWLTAPQPASAQWAITPEFVGWGSELSINKAQTGLQCIYPLPFLTEGKENAGSFRFEPRADGLKYRVVTYLSYGGQSRSKSVVPTGPKPGGVTVYHIDAGTTQYGMPVNKALYDFGPRNKGDLVYLQNDRLTNQLAPLYGTQNYIAEVQTSPVGQDTWTVSGVIGESNYNYGILWTTNCEQPINPPLPNGDIPSVTQVTLFDPAGATAAYGVDQGSQTKNLCVGNFPRQVAVFEWVAPLGPRNYQLRTRVKQDGNASIKSGGYGPFEGYVPTSAYGYVWQSSGVNALQFNNVQQGQVLAVPADIHWVNLHLAGEAYVEVEVWMPNAYGQYYKVTGPYRVPFTVTSCSDQANTNFDFTATPTHTPPAVPFCVNPSSQQSYTFNFTPRWYEAGGYEVAVFVRNVATKQIVTDPWLSIAEPPLQPAGPYPQTGAVETHAVPFTPTVAGQYEVYYRLVEQVGNFKANFKNFRTVFNVAAGSC